VHLSINSRMDKLLVTAEELARVQGASDARAADKLIAEAKIHDP
jgi:hypothetical protein